MELTKERFGLEWKNFLTTAVEACTLGREVLLRYFGNLEHIEEKETASLVSEADRESERVIQDFLKLKNPEVGFLGEETSFLENQENNFGFGKARWILDPLDGTTNYIHRFPIFCISLGLEINGELVLGVIDVPILKETYTAVSGQGAFVNGKPIKVSKTNQLSKALLATGFFPTPVEDLDRQIRIFSDLVREARGIRRPGAAAYDLTQVARGVFDAFWEVNLNPWDTAAGVVLVREAGGVVLNYEGTNYTTKDKSLIACNPLLAERLLATIKQK